MKLSIRLALAMALIFIVHPILALAPESEIGDEGVTRIKSQLKDPLLTLLASSEFTSYQELIRRVDAAQSAINAFKVDIESKVGQPSVALVSVPVTAPAVVPAPAPAVAQAPLQVPVAAPVVKEPAVPQVLAVSVEPPVQSAPAVEMPSEQPMEGMMGGMDDMMPMPEMLPVEAPSVSTPEAVPVVAPAPVAAPAPVTPAVVETPAPAPVAETPAPAAVPAPVGMPMI
jgi:hypothetical protein